MLAPYIRFLSIDSHVCSTLLSDPTSRRATPLRFASAAESARGVAPRAAHRFRTWPGRPVEFHHQSPTVPYVNLSIHTARASHFRCGVTTARRQLQRSLIPVSQLARRPIEPAHPLRSPSITEGSLLLRDDTPPSCASILSPFAGSPLIEFSLSIT